MKKIFDDFTNLYEVQKTLKFELKPVGNTQKMLDENIVFGKDKIIKEKYQKTKPFIDKLHREFVNEALEGVLLTNLKKYFNALENWKNDKKDKEVQKSFKAEEERLRKEIIGFFDKTAKDWAERKYTNLGLKNKDIGILFEEGIFDVLKKKYGDEDKAFLSDNDGAFLKNKDGERISIFDEWKGFVGYFTKFQQTRRNFYTDDGTETAIATRIINQNLKRFCDNLKFFKEIKNKIVDFSEVERNFDKSMSEIFSLDFYNECLLQNGIDTYNEILGGKTLDGGEKLRGINELVNEYRQKNKGEKIPFLKLLDKQILSEEEKFTIGVENDKQLFERLKSFYNTAEEKTKIIRTLFSDFISHNKDYDLSKIYISKEAFNTIVYKWSFETHKFEELIYSAMKDDKPTGLNYDKKEDSYKFPDFIKLDYLKKGLEKVISGDKFWKGKYYKNEKDHQGKGFLTGKEIIWDRFLQIFSFEFNSIFESEVTNNKGKKIKIGYDIFKKDFNSLISQKVFPASNTKSKIIIKNLADNVLLIYQMAKYFAVEKKREWLDEYELDDFYTNPEYGYLKFYENTYEEIVIAYNDLRNYLTRKPYSEDKWKLNFENPTLANGFDQNKESDNSAVILLKGVKYYLGLMKKGNNKIFNERNLIAMKSGLENGSYRKMIYKLFPDPAKMMPKVCFSEKGLVFFKPSKEILKIYKDEGFKKGESFSVKNMQKLIRFYSDCLTKYEGWKGYNFVNVKKPGNYAENIGEFYRDVSQNGYKISFEAVSEKYIDQKNKNGELYLFEIYNQDFAIGKKGGKKNLHTMYFENIFSQENIDQNFPIKLNGQAEIFYRPKTDKNKLGKKKDKEGKEIVDHKRYAENKIFFHCPITLNREKGSISPYWFNRRVNDFLVANTDINIIGIDRGEKHLAYYSIINQSGKILKLESLNTVRGIEYANKLEKKANSREQERKDWLEVEKIKDMKKGYISQVVRELADLVVKHNAIIVLEDLGMRFKQIRGGIEKSTYQQLEKALIGKLNFLANKDEKKSEKAGHLLKAYQLAAPFSTFKEMGKQTGIIFYTPAGYTSKTCPRCGFRKNIFYFETKQKAENDIKKLKMFVYEPKNNRFAIAYPYRLEDFLKEENKNIRGEKNTLFQNVSNVSKKDDFVIYSNVVRYKWRDKIINEKDLRRGEKIYSKTEKGMVLEFNITNCLIRLFEQNGINYKIGDLRDEIITKNLAAEFYKDLFYYLFLLSNTRNSISNTDVDYIQCPACGFDSQKMEFQGFSWNGDANGAYNIARKGVMILEKIKQYKNKNGSLDKMNWGDLSISIDEWDKFSQIINTHRK